MPQMMPLSWMALLILTIAISMIWVSLIYFDSTGPDSVTEGKPFFKKHNWLW